MSRWLPYIFAVAIIGVPFGVLVLFKFTEVHSEPAAVICTDDQTRERIRSIMLDALDEALKEHVKRMFEIWMRDATNQPARAAQGTQQAVRAYLSARSNTLRWHPPEC